MSSEFFCNPDKTDNRRILFLGADAEYTFNFRSNLMQALLSAGCEVVVAAAPTTASDQGRFEAMGVWFVPWNVNKAGLNPVADISAIASLVRIVSGIKPDILFVHTVKPVIYGALTGWFLGVGRRVAMIPGLGHTFMPPKTMKHRLVRLIARYGYRAALRRTHTIIFHNEDDIQDMKALGILNNRSDARRVHGSGVDMERFSASTVPEGPPHFVMIARLLQEKGVREFVAAARMVRQYEPGTRFSLVGAADANPSAISEAELSSWRAEGVVELVGRVPDPRPYLAACSVFVLPSWREGTPRTNLEAMASGRAIITTDVPGCRETVRHGVNGLLVPPGNPALLAEAMRTLARDPTRVREMGTAGRRMCAELFEIEKVTRETVEMILR